MLSFLLWMYVCVYLFIPLFFFKFRMKMESIAKGNRNKRENELKGGKWNPNQGEQWKKGMISTNQ